MAKTPLGCSNLYTILRDACMCEMCNFRQKRDTYLEFVSEYIVGDLWKLLNLKETRDRSIKKNSS
jgi:hypothetical protein